MVPVVLLRTQEQAGLILFAEHEGLRERGALIRHVGLFANQANRAVVTFRAQRGSGLEAGLATPHDDDAGSHLLLRLRHADDQAVQLGPHLDLAAQAAIGLALGRGRIEHGVLIVVDGWKQRKELLIHIDVARGAEAGSPAFPNDSVDSVLDRTLHDGLANRPIDLGALPLMRNISDLWHNGTSLYYR